MDQELRTRLRSRVLEVCAKANDDVTRGISFQPDGRQAVAFYTDRMWELAEHLTTIFLECVPEVIQAGPRGIDGLDRHTLPGELGSLLFSVLKGGSLHKTSPGWHAPDDFLRNRNTWPVLDEDSVQALLREWHNSHKQMISSMKARLEAAVEQEVATAQAAFEKELFAAFRAAGIDTLHPHDAKRAIANRIKRAMATPSAWMVGDLHTVVVMSAGSQDPAFMARYLLCHVLHRRAVQTDAPSWERDDALIALMEIIKAFEDIRQHAQTCLDSTKWGISWSSKTEEGVESGADFSKDNPFHLLSAALASGGFRPHVEAEVRSYLEALPIQQPAKPGESPVGSATSL